MKAVAASAEYFDNCQPRQPFQVLALNARSILLPVHGIFKYDSRPHFMAVKL
jgi:hypothetical protein